MFLAGFFLFAAGHVSGQEPLLEKTISLPRQNTTLYEALNLVSQKAGCYFIYGSENVKNDKKIKLRAENQPLYRVLDNILADPGLGYRVLGSHILIYRKKNGEGTAVRPPQETLARDSIRQIVVRGHVYDRITRAVIPFATIGIVEENIGTITNSDGIFTLKLPASLSGTSLVVSHLGYMNQRIPVQLLNEQRVDIYLDRRVISIQEVIIRYIDPNMVLEKAMDRRKNNYAPEPVYLTAFYREGVQKNDKYVCYSEAVFKVYKTPFDAGVNSDQVKLRKSRKVQNSDPIDTVYLKLKAGVQSALRLDIVKCIPDFLDLRPPSGYAYGYSGIVSYHDRDAYAIRFEPDNGDDRALYTGTLFIDKDNYAILGADFEISPSCLEKAADDLILRKSLKLVVRLEKISYAVSYASSNGRYYLNHVRCDIRLKTRLRHHLSPDHFSTFLELATCRIDTANVVKFPRQETLKTQVIFSDQPFSPGDDFWGANNIITPEAKLTEALSGIMGKIEDAPDPVKEH